MSRRDRIARPLARNMPANNSSEETELNAVLKKIKLNKKGSAPTVTHLKNANANATVAIASKNNVNDGKECKGKKTSKGAKRKIDFDVSQGNLHVTTRGRSRSRSKSDKVATESADEAVYSNLSKVQWTKEFMEKVRRSNEKAANAAKVKNNKQTIESDIVLQECVKGDSIEASIDNPDGVELLDYEDDLSIDGEDGEVDSFGNGQDLDVDDMERKSAESIEEDDIPSTSQGRLHTKDIDDNMDLTERLKTQSHDQLLENPVIQQLMAKQLTEENLSKNPVMQNMMETFFENKFQSLPSQMPAGMSADRSAVNMISDKNPMVKSPSDITVYAPALQRKLTPQNTQGVEQMTEIMNNIDVNPNKHVDQISNFVETVRQE